MSSSCSLDRPGQIETIAPSTMAAKWRERREREWRGSTVGVHLDACDRAPRAAAAAPRRRATASRRWSRPSRRRRCASSRRIEAVGTARANEQVTSVRPVTERIVRLNFDDGASSARPDDRRARPGAGECPARRGQARQREAQQQLQRIETLKNRGFATQLQSRRPGRRGRGGARPGAEARAAIGERVITAPFSGWVSLRTISVGRVVSQGTEIATISDISTVIKLDFPCPRRCCRRSARA
jgi:multidrug efflux pump subunit AcrA (membrane-fusion protein)